MGEATTKYNCHAYAWYITNGGSPTWINEGTGVNKLYNLTKFWTDGSYIETTEPFAEKIHYYDGDHSAVRSSVIYTKYESKWGSECLVRHLPDDCPETYKADKRKFYRRNLAISGADRISCGQSNYTISNIPSSATVLWTSSSNFDILSSSKTACTITPTGRAGEGWLKVTVNNGVYSHDVTWPVYSGIQRFTSISGPASVTTYKTNTYKAQPFIYGPTANIGRWQWRILPTSGASLSVYSQDVDLGFTQTGQYQLSCWVENECGRGDVISMNISVGNSYRISSTIDGQVSVTKEAGFPATQYSGRQVSRLTWQVYGPSAVARLISSGTLNLDGGNIDLTTLASGLYIFKLMCDGQLIETHKIMIQH